MSTPSLAIEAYMTPTPRTIDAGENLAKAYEVLKTERIRHLPVTSHDRLVGILTDRDVRLVMSFPDVDPGEIKVADAMTTAILTVTPDTPLEEVAAEMATQKEGSAVVVKHNRVVGIFTTVDACRALSQLLRR